MMVQYTAFKIAVAKGLATRFTCTVNAVKPRKAAQVKKRSVRE